MRNPGSGHGNQFARPTEHPTQFWPTTRRLFSYLKPWRIGLIVSVVLALISVITSIFGPKLLGNATTLIYAGVTQASQHPGTGIAINMSAIAKILAETGILYAVSGIFSIVQQIVMTRISQRVVYQLRREFKAKLSRVPIKYYDTHNNGDIMSRAVNDMDNIAGTLQMSFIQIVTSAVTFIGVLLLMLSISWALTLVALITVPMSLIVVRVVAPRSQKFFMTQQTALGTMNDQVEETFAAHTVVRTYNHEPEAIKTFAQQNDHYYKAAWKAQFISSLIFPLMNFISNFDYVMVAVIGGIQVAEGGITLGNVQAFLQYTNQFSQPITQIANMTNTIQATIASAERIFQVLDEPEMDETTANYPSVAEDTNKLTLAAVDFSYRADQPLIQQFDLAVKRNKMIAIVGPTGAGKTTIINLLERFYEVDGGSIRLDGTDVRNHTRDQIRQHFGMVLQETWLFAGTIADNIRYGRENASDKEVKTAAVAAQADQFIEQLPDGYQTVLNQDASNISQGQQQLLTIARAFLADPEILILDEATSSVDSRTEMQIQTAMATLLQHRTSFVVAHRLSTIQNADQIVVMNHGAVVETGTHQSLLAAKGFYAQLYNSQFLGQTI
ncbi:ABC transporter ATP-binding protein [Furfurilactobacillus curtus]|uniref:Multidrug ABC transporter ATP-binding protein n=1 Tax=Furfurilactobacillus curtus TaxID=1746200 RepID=A0ABQ5JN87_9LACO